MFRVKTTVLGLRAFLGTGHAVETAVAIGSGAFDDKMSLGAAIACH